MVGARLAAARSARSDPTATTLPLSSSLDARVFSNRSHVTPEHRAPDSLSFRRAELTAIHASATKRRDRRCKRPSSTKKFVAFSFKDYEFSAAIHASATKRRDRRCKRRPRRSSFEKVAFFAGQCFATKGYEFSAAIQASATRRRCKRRPRRSSFEEVAFFAGQCFATKDYEFSAAIHESATKRRDRRCCKTKKLRFLLASASRPKTTNSQLPSTRSPRRDAIDAAARRRICVFCWSVLRDQRLRVLS
ncbi:unnamed protein product [Xylocopa violacea]|uniref:Uncharacterized protein n=1 Tax=Xylocopa violacea TaxID=135666 RepID=A0ABP1N5C4_XYLVO